MYIYICTYILITYDTYNTLHTLHDITLHTIHYIHYMTLHYIPYITLITNKLLQDYLTYIGKTHYYDFSPRLSVGSSACMASFQSVYSEPFFFFHSFIYLLISVEGTKKDS